MAAFPSQNLYSQKICESYNKLLQVYSGSLLLDGTGSQVQYLNVTSSYALYAANCNSDCTFNGNSTSQSFYNLSTWVFNHNLNQKYVAIQTYDSNDNQILPSNIHLQSENTAVISFPYNLSGTAIATIGANISSSFTLHTGSTYPITASWALNAITASYALNAGSGTNLITGSTYPITASWALNAITASIAYNALTASFAYNIIGGDSVSQSFVNLSQWSFTHSLNSKPVLVQAYDSNFNQIVPQGIILVSKDSTLLTFPYAISGYAIATRSGKTTINNVTTPQFEIKKISSSYNVTANDYTILCDATSGSINIKLPSPISIKNIFNIKKIDRTGNPIHVYTTNAKYIDYDYTQSLYHRGTNISVHSDSQNQYWIL